MPPEPTARRTNVALVVAVCLLLAAAAVAALLGRGSSDESSPVTTTTVVVTGAASTRGSWFTPAGDDALGYPVGSLTCAEFALHLELGLCGVVASGEGTSFVLVGHEGFWSPDEPDPDGTVRIPFDLTVYVLDDSGDAASAVPVLSAVVSLPYGAGYDELALHRADLADGSFALVLVWSSRATLQQPAVTGVQILALVDGRPAVVATEIGVDISIGDSDGDVVLAADYLGEAIDDDPDPSSVSVVRLRPDGDSWTRSVTEVPVTGVTPDVSPAKLLNTYGFPRKR